MAAALLRQGGYRSASLYLYTLKNSHIRHGYEWNDQLGLELKDCLRAVRRGLGPPKRADALPLDAIANITIDEEDPLELAGQETATHRDAALVASWWMLREIELSSAILSQLIIQVPGTESASSASEGHASCGRATFDLPVSKSDFRALGKRRTHCCACPSKACPVAAAIRLRAHAVAVAVRTATPTRRAPLFPNADGSFRNKAQVVSVFQNLCVLVEAEGLRITGHSPRVTGAQRMALAGISEWRIQTFGRWGSSAVLAYIRETLLEGRSEHLAAEVEQAYPLSHKFSVSDLYRSAASDSERSDRTHEECLDLVGRAEETLGIADANRGGEESQLRETIAEQVRQELARVLPKPQPGQYTPDAVLNNDSEIRHVVRSKFFTVCGWNYSDLAVPSTPIPLSSDGKWCRRCCRVGDATRPSACDS